MEADIPRNCCTTPGKEPDDETGGFRIEVMDKKMAEILREKTPAERLQIGFSLWSSARHMLLSHLREENKDWTEKEVEKEVARRLSGSA
jgi:hypothetical protein